MYKSYLITALRSILRNRGYSLINAFGLTIGISAFILIFYYVQYEFSYDRYHQHHNNIYRVATQFHGHTHAGRDKMARVRGAVGSSMVDMFPEVISCFRLNVQRNLKITIGDHDYLQPSVYYAEPQIFNLFTLPIIEGQSKNLLVDPRSAVISKKLAAKYFGQSSPIGQVIRLNGEDDFHVSAVIKDMPRNSHFKADLILPLAFYCKKHEMELNSWSTSSFYTYILAAENADREILQAKLNELVKKNQPQRPHGLIYTLFLQKLTDIHLYSHNDVELESNNDITTIYLFTFLGLFILLIACLNYINLTTARSLKRAKEVGIRKVVGAGRIHLVKQFLVESMIMTMIALVFSLFMIGTILPIFNAYAEREFIIAHILCFDYLVLFIFAALVIGLLAGGYPALMLSSQKSASVLSKNYNKRKHRFSLRNAFIVFQFAISILLIICTVIIDKQLRYIINKDVGYSKDQIVTIKLRGERTRNNLETLKQDLKKNVNIINVSFSTCLPNKILDQGFFNWPGKSDEKLIQSYVGYVDYEWIDLFDIEIVKGRNFSQEHITDTNGAFLINETAWKALDWDDPIGKELIHWNGGTGNIVGVVKDFNFHSLHREIEPLYIYLELEERIYNLSVIIAGGSIRETIAFLQDRLSVFMPGYPFEYSFFDDVFAAEYKAEMKLDRLFKTFAFIAILISCLGLLGLAAYSAEQRTKEIGIRKVLGASVFDILSMLIMDFIKCVIFANIVAWPFSYYFMHNWLQNFSYRIDINVWIFIISGIIALLIAGLAVFYQALKAALVNPVYSLKYE